MNGHQRVRMCMLSHSQGFLLSSLPTLDIQDNVFAKVSKMCDQ